MEHTQHSAEDILRAMRHGVDYTFTIKLRELAVKVRPLSITERIAVVNDVVADLSKKPPEERTAVAEAGYMAMRTLELATTDAESKRAPLLPAQLLAKFTNEELLALYREYVDGCEKLDPSIDNITKAQLDEMVATAKKNPYHLKDLPRPHLEKLALCLLTPAE